MEEKQDRKRITEGRGTKHRIRLNNIKEAGFKKKKKEERR